MKTLKSTLVILLFLIGASSCNEDLITSDYESSDLIFNNESLKKGKKVNKATGSVEIIWKGGKKGSDKGSEMGKQPGNLRAFFSFNAHESADAKGQITFMVTDQDLVVHREIKATVFGANINTETKKGWFVARVISDSKGCNGGPAGEGHETGCSNTDHTDEGGCSGTDHTDEGGCGDDTTHDGGCTHDETDDGGCTDDHTTDEGGCSGADHPDEGGQKPDVTGSTGKGNPLSGKNCRIGQLILVKVHDQATPGKFVDSDGDGKTEGDGLTWKWFAPEKDIDISYEPKKLCQKKIIAGNIVVHK